MLRALAVALMIALGDSINPSTEGPALYLATSEHPRRKVAGFLIGLAAVNLFAGFLLLLGVGQLLLSWTPKLRPTARQIVLMVVGGILVGLAIVLWLRRERLARHKLPTLDGGDGSTVALGAGIGAVELLTAVPYFAAIAVIVESGAGIPGQVLMIVLYNAVYLAPIAAILIALLVLGKKADGPLSRVNEWLQARWPALLAVLGSVAGVVVLAVGLFGLLAG